MLLHVSLPDLQEAVGESGPYGLSRAIPRIKLWAQTKGFGYIPKPGQSIEGEMVPQALGTAMEAADLITTLSDNSLAISTMPYSIITLFLSYLTLWAFSLTASHGSKKQLMQFLRQLSACGPVAQSLQRVMEPALERAISVESEVARSIFRHAAYVITKVDTGGFTLSIALLLLRRSEI